MPEQPLILTLKMDEKSQAFFNTERQLYFPTEHNFLDAHLLLFHQLPNESQTYDFLNRFTHQSFPLTVTGLMNLGAGVAYRVESQELKSLHQSLSRHFRTALIPQDKQGFRPHITVMNKTTPEQARSLIQDLSIHFKPFNLTALGLDLWTYMDGPWRHERTFSFRTIGE